MQKIFLSNNDYEPVGNLLVLTDTEQNPTKSRIMRTKIQLLGKL